MMSMFGPHDVNAPGPRMVTPVTWRPRTGAELK